jgi:two-component system, NarL family, nitrate/nitrite response regulator NarL
LDEWHGEIDMVLGYRPIHVFVVAPLLVCWGLEKLLNSAANGARIAATARSMEDALDSIRQVHAHLIVVDDEGDSLEPVVLAAVADVLPVMLLTSARTDVNLAPEVAEHVAAVARKSDPPATLLRAIEHALESRRACPGHYLLALDNGGDDSDQIKISRLTPRERKLIVALLCSDTEPGKVIAARLCISEHTLRNHLSSIYGKLGVHNRLGLHTFAMKCGLQRLEARAPEVS